jgi:ELWxxDGT repeat protein
MIRPLLFTGFDQNGDDNLWVTDGTAAGTSEISVAGVGSEGLFGPDPFPYFAALPGGRVLFNGIDAKGDFDLWVTNGTAAGTSEVSITNHGVDGLNPQFLTVFGSKVLFMGVDAQIRPSPMAAASRPRRRRRSRAAASTCRISPSAPRRRSPIPRMPPAPAAP